MISAAARARPSSELVLVVEDHESTREAFALILTQVGYRVTTAGNGRLALESLRGERPCVIVLDLMMPVMDGWQFRAEQRRDQRLADIPVIVCSAAGEVQSRAALLDAAGYLSKPIDVAALIDAVRQHCRGKN
jgi:CheY-like chemotaxis protein